MNPKYGIFALDPGLSSAWATAVVIDDGTIAERLAAAEGRSSMTMKHHDWLKQARTIARLFSVFRTVCHESGFPAYFVCEDFILTRFKSSDKTGLYPVWVAAAVMGYRQGMADSYELGGYGPSAGVSVVWQQPGQAKTYCTDARLRDWGLWVRGREHERDAWRHLAFFVANEKSQALRLSHARAYAREAAE